MKFALELPPTSFAGDISSSDRAPFDLVWLSRKTGSVEGVAMPDIELASMDLAAGLTLKKVYLPSTKVDVILQNPLADLIKAAKKDKLVLQTVIDAAFDSLKSSKKEFQSAMQELDAKFEKTPLTNEKDLAKSLTQKLMPVPIA